MGSCANCGASLPDATKFCTNCGSNLLLSPAVAPIPVVAVVDYSNPVMARYRDAYMHARTVNGIGAAVKVIAIALGGLIALIGFISCTSSSASTNLFSSGVGELGGGITFVWGAALGFAGFVYGTIVQSRAQQLKASLDCAVNSSPFLTDQQRAVVMSLI